MNRLILFVALIAAFAVSSFAQAERIGVRQWKLVQLNGTAVPNSSNAYLELNADQTRFSGNAGCNRMFGTALVRGARVDLSNIGTTKMACADRRLQRLETEFVRALENVDRFDRRGNKLELYVRRHIVIRLSAVTKQAPEDPRSEVRLEDKKWTLESIKGVPVSRRGRSAFLVFDAVKRSAGGNSSCNVFGGSYSAIGNSLKLTDIVSTMRACIEDDRMQMEREFLDALRATNRYEIERGKLMLYQNRRLLVTLNGEAK